MNKADFEKVAAALNEMVRALKFEPNMSEEAKRASYEHAGRLFAKHEVAMYNLLNYALRNRKD